VAMTHVRAELLFTTGCAHADRAEELLRSVLAAEQLPVEIERVPIDDLDEAASFGFHGSPTIRLDGRDVEPPPAGEEASLACRRYWQPDGTLDGVPSEGAIRAALEDRLAARRARRGPIGTLREVPGRTMRAGFVWASHRHSLERLVRSLPVTNGLVRRFVAGEDLAGVLPALERLRRAGMRSTVDVLGESVATEAAARQAADRYLDVLDALAARDLDRNVSLKLTQMGLDVDASVCRRTVERVVARAAEMGAFVRIDMEDHTRTDATLAMARQLHAKYHNVGVVIQSYLRRSSSDIEALGREGIRVRLCKGAYNEPAGVAFATKAEVDESYAELMEDLLVNGTYPALATHDERLIERAVGFSRGRGIGPDRFEFQMLYGIRRDLQERLVRQGFTVRVYVPYGSQWYPYFMRRLAERPANVLFILRNLLRERRSG
jgi:proline dehydrogenase